MNPIFHSRFTCSINFAAGQREAMIAICRTKPLADYSESRFGQEPCEAEREDMRNRLWWARFWMRLKITGFLALIAILAACFAL